MVFARMDAGSEGVQALDAVGKALIDKEFQRAIGDGGLVAVAFARQSRQHVIGPQGLVLFQQDLQHPATDGGQPRAGGGSQRLGPFQRVMRAMGMVMRREGQVGLGASGAGGRVVKGRHRRDLTCYDITYIERLIPERSRSMRYIITFLLTATPALAEAPTVLTDIPPVHALVAQVMGDLGDPVLLLEKGADEHDFQLRPSQAGAVAGADLVVWIGPELTPWLDNALEARPAGAPALALLHVEQTEMRGYAGDHAEEAHDHGAEDPHAWLDPGNARAWLGVIATELGRLDPENAATYAANAAQADAALGRLDAEVAAQLAPVQGKPLVTYHDAFGYFGTHYGLTLAGSIAMGDASAPGAARLEALRGMLETGAVVCLFPEVQHDPALAEQLVEGTGTRIGGALDPVGSSLDPGPGAYAALISGLARTIADCAGGA